MPLWFNSEGNVICRSISIFPKKGKKMSAYAYCSTCGSKMSEPSLKEAILGDWRCKNCLNVQYMHDYQKEDALNAFEQRVIALEEKLAK